MLGWSKAHENERDRNYHVWNGTDPDQMHINQDIMYQYLTTKLFIYTNGGQMHFCCKEHKIKKNVG